MRLSVVVPFHDEEPNLVPLVGRLGDALATVGRFEVILVDDGSRDRGLEVAKSLRVGRPWLRVLALDRCNGQTEALVAGFRASRGDLVATLDADLQNPPEELPALVEALAGFDMVCGYRETRRDSWIRRAASRAANAIRRSVLRDPLRDTGCSLKVMRREVVEAIPWFRGAHRFLGALAVMAGFLVAERPVRHAQRGSGRTKYSALGRLPTTALDLLGVWWLVHRRIRHRAEEV